MLNLKSSSDSDVYNWGRNLFLQYITSRTTFEETAQTIAKAVFESFQLPDGSPQFALVRVFRFVDQQALPPDLKPSANPDHSPWMALAGTYGLEANWQNRHRSHQHKLLNIGHNPNLMAQAVYEQIGLDRKHLPDVESTPEQLLQTYSDGLTTYFFVPQAANSPYLPQQDFVKQYGIRSTLGIGCPFLSNAFYFLLAFSRSEITPQEARAFAELTAPISTFLALHDVEPFWVSEKQ